MNAKRIAVVGASGLVGSTLVKRMLATGSHDVLPLIHRSGNAWRLARLDLDLRPLDLLDYAQVKTRLAGCTHMDEKLRLAIEGNLPVPRPPKVRMINARLCAQQLRGVKHSCAKAKKIMGYQPVVSFADSMEAFRRWYQTTHHMNSAYWDLLKRLRQAQERDDPNPSDMLT
jgi:nucleoside-diphosphate-sugar epimerase